MLYATVAVSGYCQTKLGSSYLLWKELFEISFTKIKLLK